MRAISKKAVSANRYAGVTMFARVAFQVDKEDGIFLMKSNVGFQKQTKQKTKQKNKKIKTKQKRFLIIHIEQCNIHLAKVQNPQAQNY